MAHKGGKYQNGWYALLVVMSGVFLTTMDSGMVNIAMPSIMRHFRLSLEDVESVVTVYLVTITVSLVFFGHIADRVGLEKMYIRGVLVFCIGAWACFLSVNFSILLVSRCIQGIGASMMMSSGPAIIKTSFPVKHLGRNFGLVGIATASGLLSGPFVSGHLLYFFSWDSIFVLLGIFSFFICTNGFFLFQKRIADHLPKNNFRFDWAGASCWVGLVLVGLYILQNIGGLSSLYGIVVLLFVVLLFIFYTVEQRAQNPILPLSTFKRRYYWVGVTTASLSFLCLFSVLVILPFYLDYVLHLPSGKIGTIMMAVPATLIVISPCAGFFYDKFGAKYLTSLGLLVSCLALFGLSNLSETSSLGRIVTLLAFLGAGQSIFLSPNSASVLSRVGDERVGATAGILATARNLGMVLGATLATVLLAYFSHGVGRGDHDTGVADLVLFMYALDATLKTMASIAACGCLISSLRD